MDVASISDETETGLWLIDGYNRTNIANSLSKPIPATEIAPLTLQQALEYSIEINLARRHLDTAQRVLWGLRVYTKLSEREVANKVKVSLGTVNTAKQLLEKCSKLNDAVKKTEIENGAKNGELVLSSALKELQLAEIIDSKIEDIENPTFKKEMEVKYATSKYNTGADKKLELDIAMHDHPEQFGHLEKYYAFAKKHLEEIKAKSEEDDDEFANEICVMTVVEPQDFKEAANWITKQSGENRSYTIVCFFYLPEKMVAQ